MDGPDAQGSFRGAWFGILFPVAFLSALGLLTLMSAGSNRADPYLIVSKQALWLAIAFCVGTAAAFVDLGLLKRFALPIAAVSVLLLVLVIIPHVGREVNGSRRWLELGPIVAQPSDLAKFALVIFLSSYLYDNQRKLKTFTGGLVKPLFIVGLFCVPIILEPDYGTTVNDNSETYYPRNILFNKYFNNHQIAVIVPTRVETNDFLEGKGGVTADSVAYDFEKETDENGNPEVKGTADENYEALPGFSYDTSDVFPDLGYNVLTNEKGQIILAVRAGTSDYQGIHFIVVDRSALDEYVANTNDGSGNLTVEAIDEATYTSEKGSKDVTSLSDYWAMLEPNRIPSNPNAVTEENSASYYPYYVQDGKAVAKSTFVNKLVSADSTYADRKDDVIDAVKNYDSNINTYMFQELLDGTSANGKITFNDSNLEELITSYIKSVRTKSLTDTQDSFDQDWIDYADYLQQQDAARKMNETGSQALISETCAIGYTSTDARNGTGMWGEGGACYDGK